MEQLRFTFDCKTSVHPTLSHTVVGVVASGDLEILMEPAGESHACEVDVRTSAEGFRDTWQAVLGAFVVRYPFGGMRITINDAGATPAVVSLRLDQAIHALTQVSQ